MKRRHSILNSILLGCAVFSLAACITIPLGPDRTVLYYQVAGNGSANVYLMRVDGIITTENAVQGFITGETLPSSVEQVRYQLDRLERDEVNPAGIILRVNSPGGTVTASDIIYHEIAAFKRRHKIPVVVLMMDIAASGGYYIAMAGDSIVAHPTTTTGSLGVIMPSINVSKLMAQYGVEDNSVASGPLKDLGSMTRPRRAEHEAVLRSVVDDLYRRFLEVVREGRGDRLTRPMEEVADGRIFTASQALEAGLIDRIGYFEDALDEMRRLTGLRDFRVITLDREPATGDPTIYMSRRGSDPRVDALSALLGRQHARAPFYYLWMPQ